MSTVAAGAARSVLRSWRGTNVTVGGQEGRLALSNAYMQSRGNQYGLSFSPPAPFTASATNTVATGTSAPVTRLDVLRALKGGGTVPPFSSVGDLVSMLTGHYRPAKSDPKPHPLISRMETYRTEYAEKYAAYLSSQKAQNEGTEMGQRLYEDTETEYTFRPDPTIVGDVTTVKSNLYSARNEMRRCHLDNEADKIEAMIRSTGEIVVTDQDQSVFTTRRDKLYADIVESWKNLHGNMNVPGVDQVESSHMASASEYLTLAANHTHNLTWVPHDQGTRTEYEEITIDPCIPQDTEEDQTGHSIGLNRKGTVLGEEARETKRRMLNRLRERTDQTTVPDTETSPQTEQTEMTARTGMTTPTGPSGPAETTTPTEPTELTEAAGPAEGTRDTPGQLSSETSKQGTEIQESYLNPVKIDDSTYVTPDGNLVRRRFSWEDDSQSDILGTDKTRYTTRSFENEIGIPPTTVKNPKKGRLNATIDPTSQDPSEPLSPSDIPSDPPSDLPSDVTFGSRFKDSTKTREQMQPTVVTESEPSSIAGPSQTSNTKSSMTRSILKSTRFETTIPESSRRSVPETSTAGVNTTDLGATDLDPTEPTDLDPTDLNSVNVDATEVSTSNAAPTSTNAPSTKKKGKSVRF